MSSYYNPKKALNYAHDAGFLKKWKQQFFALFGWRLDPSYNPLFFVVANGFLLRLLGAYSSYYAKKSDRNWHRESNHEKVRELEGYLGYFDYLTLGLPRALEILCFWWCGLATYGIYELFETGHQRPFNRFSLLFWEDNFYAAGEWIFLIFLPTVLVIAACILPLTINLAILGLRALVSAALALVGLPFLAGLHLYELHQTQKLQPVIGKLTLDYEPLSLGQHLSQSNYSLDRDLNIVRLSATANTIINLRGVNIMNGRCILTNSNKEALRALFEAKADLKERFAFFEKQHLAAQPDFYEQALLNCLVIRPGVVAVFEDLQLYILEQAPTRLAVSLADNSIGSSVYPTARITLDHFIALISGLPNNIIYLDLSHNHLGQLSPENLARILRAIPHHIRAINLGFNEFNNRSEQNLTRLRATIPKNVRRVYWEDVLSMRQVDIQAERERLDQALDEHLPVFHGNGLYRAANDLTDLIEGYLDNDFGYRIP